MASNENDKHRQLREIQLDHIRNYHSKTTDAHIGFGRWLLAVLVTVNGGTLVAITQAGDLSVPLLLSAGSWLGWGLVLPIIAGFFGWLNWHYMEASYAEYIIDPSWVKSPERMPKALKYQQEIRATVRIAVVLTIASIMCLAVASCKAHQVLASSIKPKLCEKTDLMTTQSIAAR